MTTGVSSLTGLAAGAAVGAGITGVAFGSQIMGALGTIGTGLTAGLGGLTGAMMPIATTTMFPGMFDTGEVRSFQHGGLVTKPTMAMLGEAGPEAVVPLTGEGGGINLNPSITINATISSEMDLRDIATKISEFMRDELETIMGR